LYHRENEREDIQLEKEISDRIERERERTSECVLMIIEFDNSIYIQVTILIDQEKRII